MIWALLLGCFGRCEPNEQRIAGRCQLTDVYVGPGEPLSEAEFAEQYERELCDAMEDCACEDDTGDCDVNIDCPDIDWPTDCTFDELAARDCVRGRFSCDSEDDWSDIDRPSVCDQVYICTEDTGAR